MLSPLSFTFSYYRRMVENDIVFIYHGEISSDLVTSILKIVENKLDDDEPSNKVKKKVFNVLVECLQNLYHHLEAPLDGSETEDKKFDSYSAIVLIGKTNEDYYVLTGNYIPVEAVEGLRERLEVINQSDRKQLKAMYRDILENTGHSDKGTAGLGFIDIARKSGQKLEFHFEMVNKLYHFFSMGAKVKRVQ